jgi:ribonucleoside-diphosphate reductase alpha chain
MAVLRVDHPDIFEFISSKEDSGELNNFNISIGLTDKFMQAVNKESPYDLIDPRAQKKTRQLDAVDVYQFIVRQAWKNGDPGILFLDRINRDNPTPELGEIESTNPCGEQPLLPMEACNLGSINLAKFVVDHEKKAAIDFDGLKETTWQAVRFLDNTIDMSQYPLPEIENMAKGNRKIGLGVMGFADMLFQLKIAYNSQEAIETAEDVMQCIQEESHKASKHLAEQRGAFKNFNKSIFKNRNGSIYRNATTTTIAPTGTLSIIANCSGGIEPLFAISFVRNVMDNDRLVEVNPYFEKIAKKEGFYSQELMETIARAGSIQEMGEIPPHVRNVFVTAHDVSPEWHIKMQAAFQKYTDNAVSKTVNLPREATEADVATIYNLAYELGCKGVTIYRDGSKDNQVLSFDNQNKPDKTGAAIVTERPETLEGFTTRIVTGMGRLYVTVSELDGRPFEVFATIGKSGRSTTAKTEAIGRLVSLALRSGVTVDKIIEQLKGIGGEYPVFQDGGLILSIPDAIARVLEKRYLGNGVNKGFKQQPSFLGETCPDCGKKISFEEGCMNCHFCGFTKC